MYNKINVSNFDANVNQINLDTSGNSQEMLNMVKKAMSNNANHNNNYKAKESTAPKILSNILLKPEGKLILI